ncbi:MAG TPA: hypothetical protein VG518_08600 [Solirubrobacterales bacterium]|nr:hypothetical protein [Solirubrobacterales bacterium]
MEFLRDLFGNFASGIIRLAVAVGVLAAVYFFIVKPVLHTSEHISDSVNDSINKSFEDSFGPHSQTSKALRKANKQVQVQITRTFHQVHHIGGGDIVKLQHCVERAGGDVHRMQRCATRYAPH